MYLIETTKKTTNHEKTMQSIRRCLMRDGLRQQRTNTQIKPFSEVYFQCYLVAERRELDGAGHSRSRIIWIELVAGTAEAWRKTPSRIYEHILMLFYVDEKVEKRILFKRIMWCRRCRNLLYTWNDTRSETKQNRGLVAAAAWECLYFTMWAFGHVTACQINENKNQKHRTAHEMIKMTHEK